ncbi:MAG TPA: NAD(+) synthase [Desulfobacteria bacterium]|nr:NAD(+) synthase [Desulfobacteria bacterium]
MISLNQFGYVRVGAAVPLLKIGDPRYNVAQIETIVKTAVQKTHVQVIVFPELSLTGYTCADLFLQNKLLEEAESQLAELVADLAEYDVVVAVGMPLQADNQLFNAAVLFHKGKILGVVPKTYIPNYNEYYEKRWFSSGQNRLSERILLAGQEVPFAESLLFKDQASGLCIGVEICEDLWTVIPPSSYHALYGANLILNLSASNDVVGKGDYRRDLVKQQAARCMAGYVYVSAGQTESTTDVVFGGHSIIAENGLMLDELIFPQDSATIIADVDLERLIADRRKFNSFMGKIEPRNYTTVNFSLAPLAAEQLQRPTQAFPFVPGRKEERDLRCKEIFRIQATGLRQRLLKTGIPKVVVGISGGLDSTLALLVCVAAIDSLQRPRSDIIAVTMPGFGTTGRTYNNAVQLMKELGVDLREIPIKEACLQHFQDIGHDPETFDTTYENVQARERTQVLMDLANKEKGLVVGTGDLSELALGWATFNGDHMSMYAVNASIPKTLVRYLVTWYADTTENTNVAAVLRDIANTPVSPELLPPNPEGKIAQKTEELIGSYELHDFFLYHMLRFGYSPAKIYLLASLAFRGKYDRLTIKYYLKVFYQRFFSQQFKRSCLPDGPKVGSIALSPRGDWRMPSDASPDTWLHELESL